MASRWSEEAAGAVQRAMEACVERDEAPGVAWQGISDGVAHGGVAGVLTLGGPPMHRDAIFRIASLTKPVTAVAALSAMEDGKFALDDPVDRWLPELADRRVLRDPTGPLEDTVPAERAITVRDLLTFTSGYGYDFTALDKQTQIAEFGRLGLGLGPPAPATMPTVDEWMARLGTIPLDHQPGAAWRYHISSDILGVLLARADGRPLEEVLRRRVLDPVGMADTGFSVRPDEVGRMTTCYVIDPESGERREYDPPDGQWAAPPPFPSGGGGLVSTAADFAAFGRMLFDGGIGANGRVVSESWVAAMTSDQLPPNLAITPDGATGWGFSVDVQRRLSDGPRSPGSYGWIGGLGTAWMNDPALDLVGILFTNQALGSPELPPVMAAFWDAVYAALR
jgi:CubicO group peptidase (beta-lactamase class C family)